MDSTGMVETIRQHAYQTMKIATQQATNHANVPLDHSSVSNLFEAACTHLVEERRNQQAGSASKPHGARGRGSSKSKNSKKLRVLRFSFNYD